MGLDLVIDDALIVKLCKYGKKHFPKEFGGILVGRYIDSNKTLIIEDTALPKKYDSSNYSFSRGTTGLRRKLQDFFSKSPSLTYVGEWHTHPNGDIIPSTTDINALHEIVRHHEVFITNPVLLIVSLTRKGDPNLGFYVLDQKEIYQYEKETKKHHERE